MSYIYAFCKIKQQYIYVPKDKIDYITTKENENSNNNVKTIIIIYFDQNRSNIESESLLSVREIDQLISDFFLKEHPVVFKL